MTRHNHRKHEHCEHEEVAYCGHCQVVYCKGCKKEWGDCKLTHWPYTYSPWTYRYGTGDTITISADAGVPISSSDVVLANTCSHGN